MSKKISIPGFITAEPAKSYQQGDANVVDGMSFQFWGFDPSCSEKYTLVCKHTMTFEIPDGWDPRPGQIKALEAKKEQLQKEFSAAVLLINQQIASLQAIEYTPQSADVEF